MARKKKKRKIKNREIKNRVSLQDVVKENVLVTASELIEMIHRVNPTGKGSGSVSTSQRYSDKAKLQSLLIRRFADVVMVEAPDPDNPRLVGFRLLHSHRDACHAFIDELDEDARAWTQRRIDEGMAAVGGALGPSAAFEPAPFPSINARVYHASFPPSPDPSPSGRMGKPKENINDLEKEEWMERGRHALAQYNYAECEECYRRAFSLSMGELDPALSLLELFVDDLAAYDKAIEISNSISIHVKKNERVRLLLALAAARCGQSKKALAYIKRLSDPRTAEVYLLSASDFIKKGEIKKASILLRRLKTLDRMDLKSEIEELDERIKTLRGDHLEMEENRFLEEKS